MVFVLLFSVLFRGLLTFLILVGGIGGQGIKGPHFSPHSTAKTNDTSTNIRKNGI